MKLNLSDIKNKNQWENIGVKLPLYDVEKIVKNTVDNPRWIHFGLGNIFRIFIGGIADKLIEQNLIDYGINCVEGFDTEIVDRIYKPYDNLVLAVTLNADGKINEEVYGSLCEAITTSDRDRLEKIFINKDLQMVSFTITEKGYALKNSDNQYFPYILTDIYDGPNTCTSVIAVVCAMLFKRYKAVDAPVALVSMDNCSHNGDKLKSAIVTMAKEWLDKNYVDKEFINYIENKVSFPWTMIDKITPRPSETVLDKLKSDSIEDMDIIITKMNTYIAPFVNAEKPEYLVIEDDFPNGRPPLEKAGVYMSDRATVNNVERMKVTTCLNPLHTALAVYGCVLGYTLIADEMKDKQLKALVEGIGYKEGMKVVTDPKIISPQKFIDEVINERMSNPFIPDTPQRIATDTSQKLGIRFGETIKAYDKPQDLIYIPLAIAGWCRYLLGIDDEGNEFKLSPDPMLNELTNIVGDIKLGNTSSYNGQLRKILSNENIFGIDLYKVGLGDKIENMFIEMIEDKGAVRNTLIKYLG